MKYFGQPSLTDRRSSGAVAFRVVIYAQILWIAFTGLVFRELILFPQGEPRWLERTFTVAIMLAFVAFPLMVVACLLRWRPPEWKVWMILIIEAGLGAAYAIAILPGAQ